MSGAALAGAHLISLVLMGASRKVFGPEVVAQRLVPHRGDIGAAAFFSIGVGALVQLGLIGAKWGPGGASHLAVAALAQLGYLSSLVARGDLPPANPHRLVLLVEVVWLGLLKGSAASTQVLLEVAALWIVKLRLSPAPATKAAQQGQSAILTAPEVGSCASSGCAWWLWAARHSQGESQPLGAQPPPRVLELAASKVADFHCICPSRPRPTTTSRRFPRHI